MLLGSQPQGTLLSWMPTKYFSEKIHAINFLTHYLLCLKVTAALRFNKKSVVTRQCMCWYENKEEHLVTGSYLNFSHYKRVTIMAAAAVVGELIF